MFVEKKKIGKKVYNYLRVSMRAGDRVKTKTVAYLGKEPMTKRQIDSKISAIPKSKLESARKALSDELGGSIEGLNREFLDSGQIAKLDGLKKAFGKKLKTLDKSLLDDMFRDFKTHYIYNTTAIEGNTMTLEETSLLLNENKTPDGRELKEVYDHINEKETFDYLLENRPEINVGLVLDVHARLLKNIDNRVGSFRRHNVRVFGASFDTTPAEYVHTDMDILFRWYKKNKRILHPLVLAAVFHEKFERIHPFYDGNGRTGRMLTNLILLKGGLPPIIVLNKTRKEYYDVLSSGHKADLTKTEPQHYKPIVDFCYGRIIGTYESVFDKWG